MPLLWRRFVEGGSVFQKLEGTLYYPSPDPTFSLHCCCTTFAHNLLESLHDQYLFIPIHSLIPTN
jgi:hypothetical protein